MTHRTTFIAFGLVSVSMLLVGCGKSPATTTTNSTNTETQNANTVANTNGSSFVTNSSNNTNTAAAPEAQQFTVTGSDDAADLTTITVAQGTPVSITFKVDKNNTYHGGLDFRSSVVSTGAISSGSSKTVNFTATTSFEFQPYWPATNNAKPYQVRIVVQ